MIAYQDYFDNAVLTDEQKVEYYAWLDENFTPGTVELLKSLKNQIENPDPNYRLILTDVADLVEEKK